MRLGDLDELKKALSKYAGFTEKIYLNEFIKEIDNAPTVEPKTKLVANVTFDKEQMEELVEKAKADILAQIERPQGEWIPVSERLPDKNMPCLVSVGKVNLTQIAMYSDLMGTINHKIFWQGDYGKNNFQNITEYVNAWQPLPEPYKTDMRGKEE